MIRRLTLLLCLLPLVAAAEIYRYVDDQGKVHYTDEPPARYKDQAQAVEVEPVQTIRSRVPQVAPARQGSAPRGASAPGALYTRVEITEPGNEQTIRDASHELPVLVQMQPTLRTEMGHGVVFYLDGQRVNATPSSRPGITLTEVYRGVHTVSADIVDASGNVLAQAKPVSVFMKPPRVR